MGAQASKPEPTVAEKVVAAVDKAADSVVKTADKAADTVDQAIDKTVDFLKGKKPEVKESAKFDEALPVIGAVVLIAAVGAYLWQKKPWKKDGAPASA